MNNQSNKVDPGSDTLEYHRQHPEVSLERHFRKKALETADRVLTRKAVYLDTRYWILLRDVRLKRARANIDEELLMTITELVGAGKVICPINANILAEVLKQQDENTRTATAELIDDLSFGVALQSEDERIGTELMHCVQLSQRGHDALEPLKRLVWTSVSYVLGFVFPTFDSLPPPEMLAWQKSFTDFFWDVPFSEQISKLGRIPSQFNDSWDRIAEKINRETRAHGRNPRSFKELHLHEFVGCLEGFLPTMTRICRRMVEREMGSTLGEDGSSFDEKAGRELLRILRAAFKKNELGTQLPSVVIKSALYAVIRWNHGRQYTGNDLHDFGHAAAALPYFDYFATEKGLKHLVTNELKYDRLYETIVISEPSEFLQLMQKL